MFTCKPMNWDCCVDVATKKNDKRSNMIEEAYNKGMRMRLDADGLRLARNYDIIPTTCIAIDERRAKSRW